MWTNPVTNEEFDDEATYVQSLIDSYTKAKQELYQWGQDEKACVEALNAMAEAKQPGLQRGKILLTNCEKQVTVERKVTATYPRERGEQHPLRALLSKHDDLGDLINVDYKESGQKITALLERLANGQMKPGDNEELAVALAEVRQVKPAKPGIKVEDHVGATADQQADDGSAGTPAVEF